MVKLVSGEHLYCHSIVCRSEESVIYRLFYIRKPSVYMNELSTLQCTCSKFDGF